MPSTPANAMNLSSSAGLVLWDGTSSMTASAPTNHAIMVGTGSNSITSVGPGSTGQVLQANTSNDPTYSTATYPSTATSTGTILRADGTNWSATTATYPNTATRGDILYASATNTISSLADVATGQVLTSGGVGAVPAYSATPTVTSITFGSGTALSNYAEGTWTPTCVGVSSAGSTTYVTQTGFYTRIGRSVFTNFLVNYSAATGTGTAQVGGLPFTINNQSNIFTNPIGVSSYTFTAGYTYAVLNGQGNTTTANLGQDGSAQNNANLSIANTNQTIFGNYYFAI